ncbi:MAG: hypothetical protein EBU92_12435, partial [Betaproteobacteria bacterium]|nr:hypothetical protein [Betaproteobacteria bacterium]
MEEFPFGFETEILCAVDQNDYGRLDRLWELNQDAGLYFRYMVCKHQYYPMLWWLQRKCPDIMLWAGPGVWDLVLCQRGVWQEMFDLLPNLCLQNIKYFPRDFSFRIAMHILNWKPHTELRTAVFSAAIRLNRVKTVKLFAKRCPELMRAACLFDGGKALRKVRNKTILRILRTKLAPSDWASVG